MKKILVSVILLLETAQVFAQNKTITTQSSGAEVSVSVVDILFPILLISFLVFMIVSLVKYFLEFRLKNKLIDKGMAEQLSAYILSKNDQEKQNESIKLGILFCGIGLGLLITYLTSPIDIHSMAIMAFSIGLSYLTYFFYLKRKKA